MEQQEHTSEESTFEIVERAYTPEAAAEVVTIDAPPPSRDVDIAAVIEHLRDTKAKHERAISEIELFLGFVISHEELSVRMARIEKFVGING